MAVLELRSLCKSYDGLKAVDGISLEIEAGEIFGLLGPNGAGKSTTIDMIATILQPDEGEIILLGGIASRHREYKYRIGYVPQEIALNEQLTALENLAFVGRLYGLSGGELSRRVIETVEAVGLGDRSDEPVAGFSGGMKRRLNIACALVHKPAVVLMDEPTVGVDPHARAYIFDIVERLAEEGRAVLYTTHYMEEAQRLCRRTAIIDRGKIIAVGSPAELISHAKARREVVMEVESLSADVAKRLSDRLGPVSWNGHDAVVRLTLVDGRFGLIDIVHAANDLGLRVKNIGVKEPNLETVFLELTGHALRD
ncbi:MAG: ABC transporter ATP-binding protein [Phycisphaerae bacterium]|nr:ABC transporter ATP-binding protein [Phycisphaerae bacterium]